MFDHKGARKYLSQAERLAFERSIQGENDPSRRAFCLVLYYTGCRISEALNLTSERVDVPLEAIVFETLKRRKRGHYRAVPIPCSLAELLRPLLNNAQPTARVWTFSRATGYRLIKEHMVQAGITGAMSSPKGLRHGFAVACLTHSIPLPTVKKWLGHARLETTAIYLDVSGAEEKALAKRIWKP